MACPTPSSSGQSPPTTPTPPHPPPPALPPKSTLGGPKGHGERATGLAWHPQAYGHSSAPLLASSSADTTAKLWDVRASEPVKTFKGHENRVVGVDFHPSGDYVGTASFDHTWRLWHVESGSELLLQDGHLREVQTIVFQRDGALVATGDYSGVGHVWDLRAGKKIYTMLGHVKRLVCADFSPNGFQLATGGDDHTVKVWDLRKRACAYTVPAHLGLVSEVRFLHRGLGEALLSTSFDGTVRVWGTRDWRKLADLSGHEGKVMGGGKRQGRAWGMRAVRVWSG